MKRILVWTLVIVVSISLVSVFVFSGCKEEAPAEEVVAGEEEPAGETEVAEEAPAEEVVAGEEELYIGTMGWWGFEFAQQIKYGMLSAEKFWNESCGHNIKVEVVGPMDADAEKVYAGLEVAIAKNPTGIFHMDQGLGEEKLLLPYQENGGIVFNMGGPPKTYTTDCMVGNDLKYFGEQEALKAIEFLGDSFKYAIGTLPQSPQHQRKMLGIHSILDAYDTIEFLGMADDGATPVEGVQNYNAFLTAHPDVDVFITTSSTGGSNAAKVLEEAGYEPGEVLVISADITEDIAAGVKSGYITTTLGTEQASIGFYVISIMHIRHLNPGPLTTNDEATGHMPGPVNVTTGNPWIDKTNVDVWSELNYTE